MTTTAQLTTGHRALLLAFAALATLARGLAWVLVLALVLAQLDWLLPRKAVSNEYMDAIALEAADLTAVADELAAMLAATAPVKPMMHPLTALAQQTAPFTIKGLRRMAQEAGTTDWGKAAEPQLMASLYALV